jgi:hypothetical protein
LLVAVLGILSKCESLRDLERFARRHHAVLTESLGIELKRPPSDSAFIAQVTLYSAALGLAIAQACYPTGEDHERAVLQKLLAELDLEGILIQADALHTQQAFGSSRSRGPTSS